jgi:hypothetical protein
LKNIIDRLEAFMKYKELNDNQITVQAGLSIGQIGKSRKTRNGLHSDTIEKILHTYKELNAEWFCAGIGQMIKTESQYNYSFADPPPKYGTQTNCALCKEKDKMIESLVKQNESQLKQLNSLTGVIESLTSQSSKKNEESGEKKRKAS